MSRANERRPGGLGPAIEALGAGLAAAALALRVFGGGAAAAQAEPSLNLARAAVTAAALAVLALGATLRTDRRAPHRAWPLALGLWLAAALVGVGPAVDRLRAWLRVAEIADDAALALALCAVATASEASRRTVLALVLACGAAASGLAAKERWVDRPEAQAAYERDPAAAGVAAALRPDLESRLYAAQASGPFLLPNGLGAFSALTGLAALGALVAGAGALAPGRARASAGGRALLGALALAALSGVWLSDQKGGVLALAVGALAGLAARAGAVRPRLAVAAGGAALAIAVGLPAAISALPVGQLETLPGGLSFAVRHEYAHAALAMVREGPPSGGGLPGLGVGPGNFAVHYPRLKPEGAEETRHVHDDWLEALAESGPAALAALIALWGSALALGARAARGGAPEASRAERSSTPGAAATGSGALLVGTALGCLGLVVLGMPYRDPPLLAALALLVPLVASLAARALAGADGRWLAAGAVAGVAAFAAQAGIDFLHREPGVMGAALALGAVSVAGAAPGIAAGAPAGGRARAAWALVAALAVALLLALTLRALPPVIAADQARADAEAALQAGDGLVAITALQRAHAALPLDPGPLVTLGDLAADAYRDGGEPALAREALALYARAWTSGPRGERSDLSFVARRMGDLLLARGEAAGASAAAEAAAWLAKAVAGYPSEPGHRLALARALAATGDQAGARREAAEALRLSPLQRMARMRLDEAGRAEAAGLADPAAPAPPVAPPAPPGAPPVSPPEAPPARPAAPPAPPPAPTPSAPGAG